MLCVTRNFDTFLYSQTKDENEKKGIVNIFRKSAKIMGRNRDEVGLFSVI